MGKTALETCSKILKNPLDHSGRFRLKRSQRKRRKREIRTNPNNLRKKTSKKTAQFMRKTKIGLSVAACLAATVAVAPAAFGQTIIYDNTANFLGQRTSPQNAELGDIVTFSSGSTGTRLLSQFQFEYFMTAGTSGNETAQIFIRSVTDGINPGDVIFQTGPFSLESGFHSVTAAGANTALPETVAWTVLFSGFEGSEEAGLLFNNSSGTDLVGSNPTFNGTQFTIMRNADGSFAILDTPGIADNLSARFTAVPEPSAFALLLGGLAGFGLLRRRKA
jgi:hypothetical protein